MRIGFIGIGKMGAPMVLRLAGAGHQLFVYDESQEALSQVIGQNGVVAAPTLENVAAWGDLIITMLPNGAIVRSVCDELVPFLRDGTILIDMSTSYPLETTALRAALPASTDLLDAPVSGGVWRAELGTLTIIAGGDAETVERAKPALAAMGNVTRAGPLGSGHAMKLLNNYLSASGLVAASEAVLIGRKFGLDPNVMADVFNGSTGMNNATKVKLKQHINSEVFASGFTMGLMAKDLTLARTLAGDMGVDAGGLNLAQDLFTDAVEAFGDGADHTEIIKMLGSASDESSH